MEKIISNIDLTIYFSDNKITEIYKYDDCDCDYDYDYFINNHDNYLLNVDVNNIYNDLNKLIFDLNDNINSICSKKILNQFEINKIFLNFNSILSYLATQQQSNKLNDLITVENELSNEDVFRKIKFNNNYDENYNRKNIISFIYNLTNTIDNFYNILNNLEIKFQDIEKNEAVNRITQYLNNFIFKIFFSTFQKDKEFSNHPHISVNINNYNDIFLYYDLIKKQFYKAEDYFGIETKSDFYHRMSLFIIQFLKSISKLESVSKFHLNTLYDSKTKTNVDFLISSNSFFEGELDNVFLYNKPTQNFCNLLVNENFSFGLILDKILKFYSRSISFKG